MTPDMCIASMAAYVKKAMSSRISTSYTGRWCRSNFLNSRLHRSPSTTPTRLEPMAMPVNCRKTKAMEMGVNSV